MNSIASQSSSSGWLGLSPCVPRSSVVLTRPRPKYCGQIRFTMTRATVGCSLSTNHFAWVSLKGLRSAGGREPKSSNRVLGAKHLLHVKGQNGPFRITNRLSDFENGAMIQIAAARPAVGTPAGFVRGDPIDGGAD